MMPVNLNDSCFRILAERTRALVLLLDANYIVCEINVAAREFFYWKKMELLGANFIELCDCNPSSLPTMSHKETSLVNKVEVNSLEFTIEWQATALFFKQQVNGYLLIGDVKTSFFPIPLSTSQAVKNSNFAQEDYIAYLQEKLEYFECLINALPGNIYWKDKSGVYLGSNYNNAFHAGFTSPKDIIGKTDYDLAWKLEADDIRAIDRKVITTGKEFVAKEYGTLANGKRILALSHKVPMRNKRGEVIGILGISVDISKFAKAIANLEYQTKQAKAAATRSQIYLENLIAAMPGHVYWKDKDGVYLGSNDRNAQIAGLALGTELVGKTDYDLPWKDQADKLREADIAVMKGGKPLITEESGFIAGEQYITVLSHKAPLFDKKMRIIGTVGTSLDISELKRTQAALHDAKEKAEAANQAKSEFIANMSHDIRTPFSGILSLTQYLEKQETDPEKKEYMKLIVDTAQGLLNLLNEVLEITEVESGNHAVTFEKFSLPAVVQEIVAIMRTGIRQKGLNLVYEYPKDIPQNYIGDRLRMHRILLNIASNSLKFTDKGVIAIEVGLHEIYGNDIVIKLAIMDTGIGIPEDKFDAIFEKFTRLGLSHQGLYKGTGLGLGIVKQYLNDLKGTIKVQSKLGKGTTFTCFIPLKIAAEETLEEVAN